MRALRGAARGRLSRAAARARAAHGARASGRVLWGAARVWGLWAARRAALFVETHLGVLFDAARRHFDRRAALALLWLAKANALDCGLTNLQATSREVVFMLLTANSVPCSARVWTSGSKATTLASGPLLASVLQAASSQALARRRQQRSTHRRRGRGTPRTSRTTLYTGTSRRRDALDARGPTHTLPATTADSDIAQRIPCYAAPAPA